MTPGRVRLAIGIALLALLEALCRFGVINRFAMIPPSEILWHLGQILVSGTMWPAIALPSSVADPLVGLFSPAMISSSVDFPHPEGPTTAKNSPRTRSRSIGPSALTSACCLVAGKTRVTPRSAT